jgi:carbon starvation protein CstA
MLFVAATTLTAGWLNITDNFWPLLSVPASAVSGMVNIVLTTVMMVCAVIVLIEAVRRWYRVIVKGESVAQAEMLPVEDVKGKPPLRCC